MSNSNVGRARQRVFAVVFTMCGAMLAAFVAGPAEAGPREDIAALMPFWRANAPLCEGYPSSQACHDGDMTLFNGLLCAAGEEAGCVGVAQAQDASGRWHRSPRLRADPTLKPQNSFSWDMALGVQLYAAVKHDRAALERWLVWVEHKRPCLSQSPKIDGKTYCLVRGWPRWCTDDTEKGCTAKPQNLATLALTVKKLGANIPPPAEDKPPPGIPGQIVRQLQAEVRDANTAFSLSRLLPASEPLQPEVLIIDAAVNREGYPRNLVGTEILLRRTLGEGTVDVDLAARILATKEPLNPFFQYLASGPTDEIRQRVLNIAPKDQNTLPVERTDWAWQRANSEAAWKKSNLWDFVFIGHLLTAE